jgi:hypothetical protein
MSEEINNINVDVDAPVAQNDAHVTQPEVPVTQPEVPVAQDDAPVAQDAINVPVSKENLNKSAVAVNANVLANLVLYKSIMEKLIETGDETEKQELQGKLEIINNLITTSKDLLQLIQISLNIPEDQQINEEGIIEKSKGDINNKFKMFNIAESLGFLGLGLALLGGKKSKKKMTKKRTNHKYKKNTKSNKK